MLKDRVIYHIDCNGFFASAEETLYPELKKVPMAIAGDPENRRGVILAKNELAKRFGIRTAETVRQALEKCPSLTLRPPRRGLYRALCEQVNAIYEQYTDQVERAGIDESYLDVTGSLHLFGDVVTLADTIRHRVREETKLTVSVGISFNKVFAKLGSDYKKPDACTLITRENYQKILWPLPVSAMLMVGKSAEAELAAMNIRTIGELAQADPAWLGRRLHKLGETLHHYANGLDDSPVLHIGEGEDPQSVGHGMTYRRNLVSEQDIRVAVLSLADAVAWRLRRYGLKAQSVQVAIKDTSLKVITRQKPVRATHLADDLAREALALIRSSWVTGRPIRMLTVTAQKLLPANDVAEQVTFFDTPEDTRQAKRKENLALTMDRIREKYGSHSIQHGSILGNDLGIDTKETDD